MILGRGAASIMVAIAGFLPHLSLLPSIIQDIMASLPPGLGGCVTEAVGSLLGMHASNACAQHPENLQHRPPTHRSSNAGTAGKM